MKQVTISMQEKTKQNFDNLIKADYQKTGQRKAFIQDRYISLMLENISVLLDIEREKGGLK